MNEVDGMGHALAAAREALVHGEVPVGAVVVRNGRVLARAFNLRETLHDPTAHAERLALTLAGRALGDWRLIGCTLYVTLEPCPMCAGAIVLSRVSRLVYGASDPKTGSCRSIYRLLSDRRLNHQPQVVSGVREAECQSLLTEFFRAQRGASRFPEGCLSG